MSYSNGPSIINKNLLFYLDFGNQKSYSGIGATVHDLSGNRYNSTLVGFGSPPSSSVPYFSFPGVASSYMNTTLPVPSGTAGQRSITVDVWMLLGASPSGWYGISTQHFGNYYAVKSDTFKAIVMLTSTTNGNVANNIWPETTATIPTGVPVNLILKIVEDNAATYYINGSKDSVWGPYGNLRYQGDASAFVMGIGLSTMPFKGNIYSVKIYNTGLSDDEVKRNYNATKGRFGL